MKSRLIYVLFIVVLASAGFYGCGSEDTVIPTGTQVQGAEATSASLEGSGDYSGDGELSAAALPSEDVIRGRAAVQIRGTIVDSENNIAQVSFHGTTRNGRLIQGRGRMRFRTLEDADADPSRGRIRFRGTIGSKQVRGAARFRGQLQQDGDFLHGRGRIRFIVEPVQPSES